MTFDVDPPLSLRLAGAPPFACALSDFPDCEPASITGDGDVVRITHRRFAAEIDPRGYRAVLHRPDANDAFAEDIVRRTALGCRLPLIGGVLLHSAGALIGGEAVLFFGISGAGKSTLSELLPVPILSDELIAIQEGFVASATGVWGTYERSSAPEGAFPIRALVALERGDALTIEPLDPADAARRLLSVAVVPPLTQLWTATLSIVAALAKRVRAYRLAWTPSAEGAQRIVAAFE